jgi:hypothetical protein
MRRHAQARAKPGKEKNKNNIKEKNILSAG